MDALTLARIQFAANTTFHILFPTISIALCWLLLWFRLRWLATRDPGWLVTYRFWTQVFALTFALGVVSGVTMSFQFGTNWPGFMERVGNVAGPLLGYEVLTAFFLEAGFLGIMLFGQQRVGERMHLLATFFVAFGTALSAFWILALNSWMQTPAGHHLVDGVFHVDNWVAVIFNPSFPYRLAHMLLASGITVSFLLVAVSAWQVLRHRTNLSTARVLRTGLVMAALLVPLQMVVGDLHGLNTFKHQPAKVAAMEGVWHTERGAPLLLFAWPDEAARRNRYEVAIPRGASWILMHRGDGEIKGLDEFTDARGRAYPPVAPVFFAFRVMVGLGVVMLLCAWLGLFMAWRRGWRVQALPRWLLGAFVTMGFSGWLATLAGWYVTEIGRQPFVVAGLLRAADVTSSVPAAAIGLTLTFYLLLYVALVIAYVAVLRHMAEKAADPPSPKAAAPRPRQVPTQKPVVRPEHAL